MKPKRPSEYKAIIVEFHPAQIEALDGIKAKTGITRSELIRDAVAELIGKYALAYQGSEDEDAKLA